MRKIVLQFPDFNLEAELFDQVIAEKLFENIPAEIHLTRWGNELYGPIKQDFGTNSPVPVIPEGGIAYTNQGNYVCIFFGQNPAWPVEYIGRITGDWKILLKESDLKLVKIIPVSE